MAKTRKLSPALKAWNTHWKKVRAEMEKKGTFKKGDNLTKVFKEAKKSFKHHKKGGGDEVLPKVQEAAPVPAPSTTEEPKSEPTPSSGGRRKTRRRASKH